MAAILFKWFVFLVASIFSVFSSVMMVTRRNPVHSALWLVCTFISIAVLYFLLNATFVAATQVMVYAGAIMMLFLFVIMLIHLEREVEPLRRISVAKLIAIVLTLLLFVEIIVGLSLAKISEVRPSVPIQGDARSIGTLLYGKYLFPFEIASILLLIGIVGAIVLAKRRKE
jgi:NADH-quinone oxidoreductase subunit J